MKSILLGLLVFGLAQAAITPSNSIKNDVKKIINQIPITKISEIIQECIDDPQVQTIVAFVSDLLSKDQVYNLISDLSKAGIVCDELSKVFISEKTKCDLNSNTPGYCGGWQSVREEIQKIFSISDVADKFVDVYNKNPEFAKAWDVIKEGNAGPITDMLREPSMVAAFENCTGNGVDLKKVKEYIEVLFRRTDDE